MSYISPYGDSYSNPWLPKKSQYKPQHKTQSTTAKTTPIAEVKKFTPRSYYRSSDDRNTLLVSSAALAKLRWSTEKTGNECCFWGIIDIDTDNNKVLLKDVILAKHQASALYTDPDMEAYAQEVTNQYLQNDLEPWQLACWIHTHPTGISTPSLVDEETFEKSWGKCVRSVMLIMTHDGSFYAKLGAYTAPIEGLLPTSTEAPLHVAFENVDAKLSSEESDKLDLEFADKVSTYVRPPITSLPEKKSERRDLATDSDWLYTPVAGMDYGWGGVSTSTGAFQDEEASVMLSQIESALELAQEHDMVMYSHCPLSWAAQTDNYYVVSYTSLFDAIESLALFLDTIDVDYCDSTDEDALNLLYAPHGFVVNDPDEDGLRRVFL